MEPSPNDFIFEETLPKKTSTEILITVLTIIGILGVFASLLLSAVLTSRKCGGGGSKTQSTLSNLKTALKSYETDYGSLPPHVDGTYDSDPLVIYLDGDKSNGGPKNAYYEFKEDELEGNKLLDPWGNEIHYRQPGNSGDGTLNTDIKNKNSFDLWSEGPISVSDGDTTGEDDITNWKQGYGQ